MKIYVLFIAILIEITNAFGGSDSKQKNTVNTLGYEIKISELNKDTGVATVEIAKDGKVVEKIENYDVRLLHAGYLKFAGDEKIKPYIIFSSWSGGNHCCAGLTAYELEPKFKKSFDIGGDHLISMVVDSPSNEYYIRTIDHNFLYWHTCYADSANIIVNLQKTRKGKFEISETDNYVNDEEILYIAKSIFDNSKYWENEKYGEKELYYPGKTTEKVVELIYKNRPEIAIKFLDIAWNPKNPNKEQFKKDLKNKLNQNDYWLTLEKKGYKLPF